MHGGSDVGQPLRISRVNPGSKAAQKGVREGDTISYINGTSTAGLSTNAAHALMRGCGTTLKLGLNSDGSPSGSPRKRMQKTSVSTEGKTEVAETRTTAGVNGSRETTTTIASAASTTQTCSATLVDASEVNGQAVDAPTESSPLLKPASSADALDGPSSLPASVTLDSKGVWTPGQPPVRADDTRTQRQDTDKGKATDGDGVKNVAPVWTPKASPTVERKEFRPIKLDTSSLKKQKSLENIDSKPAPPPSESFAWNSKESGNITSDRSPHSPKATDIASVNLSSSLEQRLNGTSHLPRAQNPTITLLQKAREGQLPKKEALYIDHKMNPAEYLDTRPAIGPDEQLYTIKREYESEDEEPRKFLELTPKKYDGIGPTTKDGIPVGLRTEKHVSQGVKDEHKARWYKRMYESLNRPGASGRYPYHSSAGYMSEPDLGEYDSDVGYYSKYATLDRRRLRNKDLNSAAGGSSKGQGLYPSSVRYNPATYKNQPGKIADYEPGHSSIADKEAKEQESRQTTDQASMSYALKEAGYESDSTLVFKRREEKLQGVDPTEQKIMYRDIQKGGEVPLTGLRKTAPEKPKEPVIGPIPLPRMPTSGGAQKTSNSQPASPHKYLESQVNIHYRSPIRNLEKEYISEEELKLRQEDAMKRIYEEERRKKYLQELEDIEMRRHTDNFTPTQKSPIPLNRYDNFFEDPPKSKLRERTPEPKMVARALYSFTAQSAKELSFNKGDIIFVNRLIDRNWYEGEHNAMVGIFPVAYVEIIPYDGVRTIPKKPREGQARARYNFIAQSPIELSLVKGELVVLLRRIDGNWYEGKIGNRTGIFPVTYVDVLTEPRERSATPGSHSPKTAVSMSSHSHIVNGTRAPVQPSYYGHLAQRLNVNYHTANPYATLPRPGTARSKSHEAHMMPHVSQSLHIDTHSEPVPYRALYNYQPQNDDELELRDGDTVYVMEKCDDGWYVGTSQRTGLFGTFPGNYVERM